MTRVLETVASGFLGKKLCNYLADKGFEAVTHLAARVHIMEENTAECVHESHLVIRMNHAETYI